jgi:CspA family cold shock protein
MRGRVVEFDEDRGLGLIAAGEATYSFHCTQIADGSRSVDVGADVSFEVRAGHLGRWEATAIATA